MLQNKIISWYLSNKRELPWRNTRNPYFIWLSEIILQQTRVAQGLPYYEKFVEHYPTIYDLANASEEEVLRLWQGLGYYSRGRNLHGTAKHIAGNLSGIFPESFTEILKLKGVGNYTAAAIASFAYSESVPAIDGNAIRVISRLFRITGPVDQITTLKEIVKISEELISQVKPDIYNQAIMEFGAMLCTPKNPKCDICPVQENCLSFPARDFERIPVKSKKTKVTERDIHYIVIENEGRIYMQQRTDADIWKNMYDFPEIESQELPSLAKKFEVTKIISHEPVIHLLSHRRLKVTFTRVLTSLEILDLKGKWYTLEQAESLPKPKVVVDFINMLKSSPFEES
jgi:A/G-specific adenine glycosylase